MTASGSVDMTGYGIAAVPLWAVAVVLLGLVVLYLRRRR